MVLSVTYILSWMLVFGLSFIPVSNIVRYPSLEFMFFVLVGGFFLFFYEIILTFKKNTQFKSVSEKNEKLLLISVLVLFFISLLMMKGALPVFAVLGLDGLRYNEYGIKGVQGLINALYLALMAIMFFNFMQQKGFNKALFFLLLAYPILIMSRQVLMSLFIQLVVIWFLLSPKPLLSKLTYLGLSGVAVLIGFGVLGDLRMQSEFDNVTDLLHELIKPTEFGLELPNSLLWVYTYMVSPLSNLDLNISEAIPSGDLGRYFVQLLPSPIRPYLGYDSGFEGFENVLLIHQSLNMGTTFFSAYLTMGWIGMWVHFSIFLLLSIFVIVKKNENKFHFLMYAVLVQIGVLSIFANLLFYLPVIFQLLVFFLMSLFDHDQK